MKKTVDGLVLREIAVGENDKLLTVLTAAEGKITIAGLRDMIGTSRKNAKPLLEYLDSVKVTRRNGTESERVAY